MNLIKDIFKKRPKDSKKGDFGKLLIVGGSNMYTGAPALSALASLNSGCDICIVAAPKRAADIVASFSPCLITVPLEGDILNCEHIDLLTRLSLRSSAIVIGPGLTTEGIVLRAVADLMKRIKLPCVIDADAICAIKKYQWKGNDNRFIITAHIHEFLELTGIDLSKKKDKVKEVEKASKQFGAVILLKGNRDIISDGKRTILNKTGNAYMTTGGTGDVLAGICGALLARGISAFDAAVAGAYICGTAGDAAAAIHGESLFATDVVNEISNIINGV
ncbi:MAG: NAD(P)H-hydrate dehydratase [Candidatus Nanohalarchaeota archaeon]|nr:MAG: NAD(P)H-hydrate dehydratase [Candidatus Nanohaloarchaeota archaeon]